MKGLCRIDRGMHSTNNSNIIIFSHSFKGNAYVSQLLNEHYRLFMVNNTAHAQLIRCIALFYRDPFNTPVYSFDLKTSDVQLHAGISI